jgi:hypothetical protein
MIKLPIAMHANSLEWLLCIESKESYYVEKKSYLSIPYLPHQKKQMKMYVCERERGEEC